MTDIAYLTKAEKRERKREALRVAKGWKLVGWFDVFDESLIPDDSDVTHPSDMWEYLESRERLRISCQWWGYSERGVMRGVQYRVTTVDGFYTTCPEEDAYYATQMGPHQERARKRIQHVVAIGRLQLAIQEERKKLTALDESDTRIHH